MYYTFYIKSHLLYLLKHESKSKLKFGQKEKDRRALLIVERNCDRRRRENNSTRVSCISIYVLIRCRKVQSKSRNRSRKLSF